MSIEEIIISWQNEILKIQGIKRKKYFDEILASYWSKPIKIISWFRRSWKSFLLQQIAKSIVENYNFNIQNILYLNFEDFRLSEYLDSNKVYDIVKLFSSKIAVSWKKILIFDEIQLVDDWNKLVRTIYELNKNWDYEIFITWSNSNLLSSELWSNLAGRFIEFKILPFEFVEFLHYNGIVVNSKYDYLRDKDNIDKLFSAYVNFWWLPEVFSISSESAKKSYVNWIITKVILDDIIKRFSVRDVSHLEKLLYFVISDIGSILSIKNISNRFKNIWWFAISENQIIKFLDYIKKTFAIYELQKFDWKLNKIFETTKKYYCVDNLILTFLSQSLLSDIDKKIENIVFLKLNKYYDNVNFARNKEWKELDFVVKDWNDYLKIQVCMELNENNKKRELWNFILAQQYMHWRNLLIVLNWDSKEIEYDWHKISVLNIIDFLLDLKS